MGGRLHILQGKEFLINVSERDAFLLKAQMNETKKRKKWAPLI